MPTKRTPLRRELKRKLTPECVALFRRGEELQEVYYGCIRDRSTCRSTDVGRHCPECAEFVDVSTRLERTLLKLPPWHQTLFDPGLDDDGPMPQYMARLCIGKTWANAAVLRRALQEAAEAE
jgi:hypothetical protein